MVQYLGKGMYFVWLECSGETLGQSPHGPDEICDQLMEMFTLQ